MIQWHDGPDEGGALDDPASESAAPAARTGTARMSSAGRPGMSHTLGLLALFMILVGVAFMSWRSFAAQAPLVGGVALGETEPETNEEPSATIAESPAPSESTAGATETESAGASETIAGATPTAPGTTAVPRVTPKPTVPRSSGIYGSAIAIDTKDNFVIGGPSAGKLSHRFRATTSASLSTIRWAQRGGSSGYSGGNGGTIRISVEADAGGQPSGTPLASLTYTPKYPGGNWVQFYQQPFESPAKLTAGRVYDIVFENVDQDAAHNYISANDVFVYRYVYSPRQVAMGDDYAVLYSESGGGWRLRSGDTPVMDLTYSNGRHDGMGYIEAMAAQAAYINGPSRMAREHFTVSGSSRVVVAATVRVMRLSGGSDPLELRLETGSGAAIETVSIPASSVPVSTVGDTSGGTWVTARFSQPHTLASGSTYNLRLSTSSGITYVAIPIREGTDSGFRSYRFTDGDGQLTTNGSAWANCYRYSPVDLQFYFS